MPAASGEKKPAAETESRWARWSRSGFDKSIKVSDWISPYANKVSTAVGGERFWPQSNDFDIEIEKCERILRAFTVEGIQQKEVKEEQVKDENGNWIKKKVRTLRKIPPSAIKNAKGIAIYSSMRSGIAPLGGGGGSGLFLARLPNGSWSAPSAISPQSGAVGLLIGIDFIDVILLINSDKTLETFKSHRIDLGAETGITAGPYGTGFSAEASYDRAPVYSYVRNRGAYAGVELMGQVFLHRFDENERFYYWPGIGAREILEGKIPNIPPSVFALHRALRDAESGVAQGGRLDRSVYDVVKIPESEAFKQLAPSFTPKPKRFVPPSRSITPRSSSMSQAHSHDKTPSIAASVEGDEHQEIDLKEVAERAEQQREEDEAIEALRSDAEDSDGEVVREGERLRLPPTPAELEMMEAAGIKDEEDLRLEQEDRIKIYELPAPPIHPDVRRHWETHSPRGGKRREEQLQINRSVPIAPQQAPLIDFPPTPGPDEELPPFVESADGVGRSGLLEREKGDWAKETHGEGILARGVEDEEEAENIMQQAVEGDVVAKRVSVTGTGEEKEVEVAGAVSQLYQTQEGEKKSEVDEVDHLEAVDLAGEESTRERSEPRVEESESNVTESADLQGEKEMGAVAEVGHSIEQEDEPTTQEQAANSVEEKSSIPATPEENAEEESTSQALARDSLEGESSSHAQVSSVKEDGTDADGRDDDDDAPRPSLDQSVDTTHEGQFASVENESFEETLESNEPVADTVDENTQDAQGEESGEPKSQSAADAPQTPTMDESKDGEAAGLATPSDLGTPTPDSESKSTPSRPPRRKRPPQKKK